VASAGPYASRSRQITMPVLHHSKVFLQAGCPSCCPTISIKTLKAIYLLTYLIINYLHIHTCTHRQPFNGPLSWTTRVGRYQRKRSPTHSLLTKVDKGARVRQACVKKKFCRYTAHKILSSAIKWLQKGSCSVEKISMLGHCLHWDRD